MSHRNRHAISVAPAMKSRFAFRVVLLLVFLAVLSAFPHSAAADGVVVREPKSGSSTTRAAVNVLGTVEPGSQVKVNDAEASVFSTGIFVRDQLPLELGPNTIRITATSPSGSVSEAVVEVTRDPVPTPAPLPPSLPLFLEKKSFVPARNVILAPGEELEIACTGAPGNKAFFLAPTEEWLPMAEELIAATQAPTGRYRAVYVAPDKGDIEVRPLRFRLTASSPTPEASAETHPPVLEEDAEATLGVWGRGQLRLAVVSREIGYLVYGLHDVRLGGPYLAEVPRGTLLRITGRRGSALHVQLSPTLDAWIDANETDWAPASTPIPHLSFTSISATGNEKHDIVTIPYSVRVPYAVNASVGSSGRACITIDLYGAHHAATWISHRPSARMVREVVVEQPASEVVRVRVELNNWKLWGYRVEATTTTLQLRIRRPPQMGNPPDSPLKGLTIALEAGHGGPNSGAVGVSGSLEKDINRATTDLLEKELVAAGATVVQCRVENENPGLIERRRVAEEADADLFISIHANAAGTAGGYLRVSGTSTYYKHSFSRDLSAAIHARLLEKTGLGDFGNVGNFNYTPIRTTWMPAMLVEQAFMSNPEDEAKMLDPAFQQIMAEAVRLGMEDYLNSVRE